MIDEITITSLSGRGSVTMRTQDYTGFWLGPVDWGQVTGSHQTYTSPNQVGETIASTAVGPRPLSITGWVIDAGTGDLRQRCDFLNAFFSPVEDYALEYRGKKLGFRPDGSVDYSPERKENNQVKRKFLIQATCSYPLFTDLADTAAAFDVSGKLFRFPNNFGRESPVLFGTKNQTYTLEVNNTGGFETWLTARFSFSGTVDNPLLKNLATGEALGVLRQFSRGEVLEACTMPDRQYLWLYTPQGQRVNILKNWDLSTDWIQLKPGRNRLAVGCKDPAQRAAMTVTIFFTPLYMEIQ